MSGLTPQMIAAIQAASQAGGAGATQHQTNANIGQDMYGSLVNSGLFDPAQLAAVDSTFSTNNTPWGNGAPATSAWDSQITNAIGGVNQNQQNVAANTQAPNAAVAAGYNPIQPAYLSQPATLNATTVQPQYLSPQLTNSLGSQQTIGALTAANQPTFNQQDQQMMQALATAGLAPSSTAGQTALNNLSQQQIAGMDPSIASAIQNSQSNQLNAGQFNANTGNTASTYNANAQNNAASTNLANQNAQQEYNANAYNNAGNTYFNAMTGAYNNNANAFNALNTAGLSGAQGLAGQQVSGANQLAAGSQNTFPTYGGNSTAYGALGSALGGSSGSNGSSYSGGYSPEMSINGSDYGGSAAALGPSAGDMAAYSAL